MGVFTLVLLWGRVGASSPPSPCLAAGDPAHRPPLRTRHTALAYIQQIRNTGAVLWIRVRIDLANPGSGSVLGPSGAWK
jgi:hypothetical protein